MFDSDIFRAFQDFFKAEDSRGNMKFNVGEWIVRHRRKEPRQVIAHENGHYILSDSKNALGSMWFNKHIVESQFERKAP